MGGSVGGSKGGSVGVHGVEGVCINVRVSDQFL